ncbi:NAD(P)-dependent oxidoreductase [Streptomyces albidoflavus]
MNAHQENPHPTAQLPTPVTVIGLGPMGQAMVRSLLAAGHEVTVWNRTASRADGVVSDGAKRATTPREAIEASPLTLLSLTDYQAMYDILADTTASLSGRTLVNLSSDTPGRSREAATWASGHGAAFLTGGVMNPAPMVGTDEAYVYYSGDEDVLTRHRAALAVVGTPKYLGADPGLAQLMYQAHLTVFLTSLSSLMHATALLGTAGITAEQALPELFSTTDTIGAMMTAGEDRPGAALDAGEHPGDLSTVTMMGATADHILETSATLGLDLALPNTILGHYRRAVEDGHGGDNWTRIIDGMREPRVG